MPDYPGTIGYQGGVGESGDILYFFNDTAQEFGGFVVKRWLNE